jgi:hypothetical protein
MIGREDCLGKTLGCPTALRFVPSLRSWNLVLPPFLYIALETPRGFITRSDNDMCDILIFRKKLTKMKPRSEFEPNERKRAWKLFKGERST